MSSSDSSGSVSDDEFKPTKALTSKQKHKALQKIAEPVSEEAGLKGFASAFQTILERPTTPSDAAKSIVNQTSAAQLKRKAASERAVPEMVAHESVPDVSGEAEVELKSTAQRGVVKLFRAVAMHRKRLVDTAAKKGIGVMRNGQIRRVRQRPGTVGAEVGGLKSTKSMAGLLEALKAAKSTTSSAATASTAGDV